MFFESSKRVSYISHNPNVFLLYSISLETSNLYVVLYIYLYNICIFSMVNKKVGALESNNLIYITALHLLSL